MDYSLFIRLRDGSPQELLAQFRDIVSCWPEPQTETAPTSVRAASLIDWQHARWSQTTFGQTEEDYRDAAGPQDRILNVERFFDTAVCSAEDTPQRRLLESQITHFPRSIEAPLVTHHGQDTKARRLCDDCGDVTITFSPFVVCKEPVPSADAQQQSRSLRRFRDLLNDLIIAADPEHVLLEKNAASDGAVPSSLVYHRDPRDYVRDLARALFLMEGFLVTFAVPKPWTFYPSRTVSYFELGRPERLCDDQRLRVLHERCTRAAQVLRESDPAMLQVPVVHLPLVKLTERATLLCDAIETSTLDGIIETLMSLDNIEVDLIRSGCIVNHVDYGNGSLREAYEGLMRLVLE